MPTMLVSAYCAPEALLCSKLCQHNLPKPASDQGVTPDEFETSKSPYIFQVVASLPTKACSYIVTLDHHVMIIDILYYIYGRDVIYEQRELVFHRDIQTRENNYEITSAKRECFHTLFSSVWISW